MQQYNNNEETSRWERDVVMSRRAGEALRTIRLTLTLKLAEVAARSHGAFPASWLSNFERGGLGAPSFIHIMALAEVYGLSLEQMRSLFFGEPITWPITPK